MNATLAAFKLRLRGHLSVFDELLIMFDVLVRWSKGSAKNLSGEYRRGYRMSKLKFGIGPQSPTGRLCTSPGESAKPPKIYEEHK